MRRLLKSIIVSFLVVSGIAACGGGGGGESNPGNPSTGTQPPVQVTTPLTDLQPVSDADYETAIATVGVFVKQGYDSGVAAGLTRQQIAENTLATIEAASATIPGFADAGLSPEGTTVWVRLKDGTPIGQVDDQAAWMVNAKAASLGSAGAIAAGWRAAQRSLQQAGGELSDLLVPPASAAGSTLALPASKKAFISDFDNLAPAASTEIAASLTKRGYQVTALSSPDAQVLRGSFVDGSAGFGVVWMSSHAGTWVDKSGVARFGMVTGEPVGTGACANTPANCAANRSDIAAHRAGIIMNKDGTGWIAITEDFMSTYWKFPANSLVYLDFCSSQAFFPSISAGTLMGWSAPVYQNTSESAARWFFDRVLGGNAYQPNTPKQRPFSAQEVLAAMQSNGMDTDTGPNATARLALQQNSSNETILVPSLRNMMVDENKQELSLYGEFGSAPGTVTIDGTDKTPTWSERKITVSLANGDKGPVEVKVDGITGNAVPLTSWNITYNGKWNAILMFGTGNPSPYYAVNCSKVHWRADIHPYRLHPEETPHAGDANDANPRDPSGKVTIIDITRDSQCSSSAGGTGISADGNTRVTLSSPTTALTWYHNEDAKTPPWFFGIGWLIPEQKKFTLDLNSWGGAVTAQYTNLQTGTTSTINVGGTSTAVVGAASLALKTWTMDASFGINVSNDVFSLGTYGPPGDTGEVSMQGTPDPGTVPTSDTES